MWTQHCLAANHYGRGAVADGRGIEDSNRFRGHRTACELLRGDRFPEHRAWIGSGVLVRRHGEGSECLPAFFGLVHVAAHQQRRKRDEAEPVARLEVLIRGGGKARGDQIGGSVGHLLHS